MKKNKKLKNNTKTNYDGIAKQLLDYLNDENIFFAGLCGRPAPSRDFVIWEKNFVQIFLWEIVEI